MQKQVGIKKERKQDAGVQYASAYQSGDYPTGMFNLYLEETHGWMECEHCKQTVQVLKFAADKKVPLYTPQQLVACFAAVT